MRPRSTNNEQYWQCEVCERRTEHRIGDRDSVEAKEITRSEWRRYGEVWAYERVRVCSECRTPTTTIEIRYDQFQNLRAAASRVGDLESFKTAVETALGDVQAGHIA